MALRQEVQGRSSMRPTWKSTGRKAAEMAGSLTSMAATAAAVVAMGGRPGGWGPARGAPQQQTAAVGSPLQGSHWT